MKQRSTFDGRRDEFLFVRKSQNMLQLITIIFKNLNLTNATEKKKKNGSTDFYTQAQERRYIDEYDESRAEFPSFFLEPTKI